MTSRLVSILPVAALAIWLIVIAWPTLAAVGALAAEPAGGGSYVPMRPLGTLVLETSAYAFGVAIAAMLIGWAPGRRLGRAIRGGGLVGTVGMVGMGALLLLPLCLPAYAVFYTWWQSWPADSAVHRWAVANDMVPTLRRVTLVLGLVCWSWPLVSWCVAGAASTTSADREAMLRLDGAGWWRRIGHRLRGEGAALGIGGLVVFTVVFTNTTCFDLAQVFSFGNELRAKDALGAPARDVLVTALPTLVPIGLAGLLVWRGLHAATPATPEGHVGRSGRAESLAVAGVWLVSVLVPFALLLGNLRTDAIREYATFYAGDLARSVAIAACAGGLAAVVGLGLLAAWMDDRRVVRLAASGQAAGWLLFALVPGTIVGIALEAAYNRGFAPADWIYRSETILVVSNLARFGVVAALLAWWATRVEPRELRDLRHTDGVETTAGQLAASRPRAVAAAAGAAAIVLVLALGEVPVTARVHPPGSNPLAVTLLNDMHYQRPQAVTLTLVVLFLVALGMALVACAAWVPLARIRARAGLGLALTAATLVAIPGCGGSGEDEPLDPRNVFGATGTALGQFSYPRCLAVDADGEHVYVIDKTARVQRFDLDGNPEIEWRMPERENGKPTGVSVAPDGRVFVADTHYYRIIAYDREGRELMRFGKFGEGPGEFIYTTNVAFGPGGRLYVGEYGGHDRVQVFTPAGEYLFEFGRFGSGPGEFDRPQALRFNPEGTELYIADACNHRIVVVDPEGRPLRTFGEAGTGPGQLHYPYGLTFLKDGSLLVAEFGNNRLQRFSPDGISRGRFGRLGAGPGELRYPWDVDTAGEQVFVLDSGNNRVQTIRSP